MKLEKLPVHHEFDDTTRIAVEGFNLEVQRIRDERASNECEAERIIIDALNGLQSAAELIKRVFTLKVHALAAEIDELKLAPKLADVEEALNLYWKGEAVRASEQEKERRAKLETLADELGYANPGRERHQFVLQDTERRRLEETVKSCRAKSHERLNHEASGEVMARCEQAIREALKI